MAEVKILIEGYAADYVGGRSCSTITLVQDNNLNIVVDPGTLPNQKMLVAKLKKVGLNVDEINIVFITHSHMDHYRNIGMFKNAKSLDHWGWWQGDVWKEYKNPLSDNIKVFKTPGHSYDSVTLLVKTKDGTVAICGDVFWKKDFPAKDPYASDKKKLQQSRKRILKIADYIIPGHGKIYKVNK
ncbi:MBL fold metallo-hydrolase [Patescibacteria group bacterium]|nr:MBL fold metallo-hydrolase [Patescibacteria group bacterium]